MISKELFMKLKKLSKKGAEMMIVYIILAIVVLILMIIWMGGIDFCKLSGGFAC